MSKKRLLELAGVDVSEMNDEQLPADTPTLPPEEESDPVDVDPEEAANSDSIKICFSDEESCDMSMTDLFNLAKTADSESELRDALMQQVSAASAEDDAEQAEDAFDDIEPPQDDDLGDDELGDELGDDEEEDDNEGMVADDSEEGDSFDFDDDESESEFDDEDEYGDEMHINVKESVGEKNGMLSSAKDATVQTFDELTHSENEEPTTTDLPSHEVPAYVKQDLNAMITNHKQRRDYYRDVENDHTHRGKAEFHEKVLDCAETVKEYLDNGDVKGAAHFITTLMSDLQHRFPATVWKFLSSGKGQAKSLKDYYTEVTSK